jgi:hypothetical protein
MSFCPFVPGQKHFLVPLSLCTGTRAGAKIPGQKKKRSKTGKGRSKTEEVVLKQKKDILKQEKMF